MKNKHRVYVYKVLAKKKAIDDAKEKAEALAKKLDKTIGDIVAIADQNTNMQYIQSYGTSTVQSHSVTVTFELK